MSKISIVQEAAEKALAAESERTLNLLRTAEKFAAATIIVTGFQLLEARTLMESTPLWVQIPCGASLAALCLSMFFAFRAMRLKGYADYPRGNKLWDSLKPENITDDAAQEALVQLLLSTRQQNALLNDTKVKSLHWCGCLFLTGFLLVVGSQLLEVIAFILA